MKKTVKYLLKQNVTSVILAVVIISAVFSVGAKGFASPINIKNILKAASITTVTGLAQLSVLSVGQFNLALGSMGCLTSMAFVWLMQSCAVPPVLAIPAGILMGMILGLMQGMLVAKTRLNPFIVTLSLNSIFLGIATAVFRGTLLNQVPQSLKQINRGNLFGVPLLFVVMLVIVALIYVLMNKTTFGRRLLLAGESESAALIAGLQPKNQYMIAHTMSGALAAIAGILTVSRMGAAQLTVGDDWMMMSFAAPVLGGTLLSGGKVAVVGTIVGALLLNVINYGLVLMNVNLYWTQTFLGVILVASFMIDFVHERLIANAKA